MLIDIHAHLDHERFKQDLDKIIENARKANVKTIITSGVNSTTNRHILKIKEKYPDIVQVSFGLYPMDVLAKELENNEVADFARDLETIDVDAELKWIEKNKDKCLAIGEVGLDFSWETGKEQEQIPVFEKIIEFVKKIDKPIIVHTRKAEKECIDLLEKHKAKKVVLHCFSGKVSLIQKAVELGYFFSVPPVITRLQHFQTLVGIVPISQILTETDAPYLSPVQGERNEPANVSFTIKEIAKIKQISEKEVEATIWENAKKLFQINLNLPLYP